MSDDRWTKGALLALVLIACVVAVVFLDRMVEQDQALR